MIDPRPLQATLRQMEANLRRDQARCEAPRRSSTRTRKLAMRRIWQSPELGYTDRPGANSSKLRSTPDQAQIDNAKIQLEYTVIR